MKKQYQRPVTREVPIVRVVPLLADSNPYIKETDAENGGGINTGNQTSTGFSRRNAFDYEEYDDDY